MFKGLWIFFFLGGLAGGREQESCKQKKFKKPCQNVLREIILPSGWRDPSTVYTLDGLKHGICEHSCKVWQLSEVHLTFSFCSWECCLLMHAFVLNMFLNFSVQLTVLQVSGDL